MNPLFNKSFGNALNMVNQFKRLQKDPSQIGNLLLQNGRITNEQYNAISGMSPSQIGNYLMNNGVLNQGDVDEFVRNKRGA